MFDKLPNSLFKFYGPSEINIETLGRGMVYFPSPPQLNDPFDCQITIDTKYPEEDIPEMALSILRIWAAMENRFKKSYPKLFFSVDEDRPIQRRFDYLVEDFLSCALDFGIYSMTEEINNPLLWSHYANSYKGFAIEFDPHQPYIKSMYEDLYQVRYETSVPEFTLSDLLKGSLHDIEKMMFTIKGEYWRYEKEWRLIAERGEMEFFIPFKVKAIYFGFLSTDETTNTLKSIFGDEIEYFVAVPNEKSFDLGFHDYLTGRARLPGIARQHRKRHIYFYDKK